MQFDADKYIDGPAVIEFDEMSYYTEGDIGVQTNRETWEPKSAMHGSLGPRLASLSTEINFKPVGEVKTLAKYFPYSVTDIGKKIFASAATPCVVHSISGDKYTFAHAAISKMPSLMLSATAPAFGDMSILCLGKPNVDPQTDEARIKVESAAFDNADFDPTKIISPGYTAAFGLTPYDAIESEDGFTFEPVMSLKPQSVNRFGQIGAKLTDLVATVRFIPVGLTGAQLITLGKYDGATGLIPGQNIATDTDLVISGTGLSVTLHNAGVAEDALRFGEPQRLGEVMFVAKRAFTDGVADALWIIAES